MPSADDPLVLTRPLTPEERAVWLHRNHEAVVYVVRDRPLRIVWIEHDGRLIEEQIVRHD